MEGRFAGPVGTFQADDVIGGRPVKVQLVWTDLGDDRAQWEQAFSHDEGQTWDTNWFMSMTRA